LIVALRFFNSKNISSQFGSVFGGVLGSDDKDGKDCCLGSGGGDGGDGDESDVLDDWNKESDDEDDISLAV
jgi:hypothetical protein